MLDLVLGPMKRTVAWAVMVSLPLLAGCDEPLPTSATPELQLEAGRSETPPGTVDGGYIQFGAEFGCAEVYLGGPPAVLTYTLFERIDMPEGGSSATDNSAHGWGGVEASVSSTRIKASGGARDGFPGSLCTMPDGVSGGWLYGRGRGDLSFQFTLAVDHDYVAIISGDVAAPVSEGTGTLPAGTYTVTAQVLGNNGFSLDIALTPKPADPVEITVVPKDFVSGEDTSDHARFAFQVQVERGGSPVEGALIKVGGLDHGTTDANGRLDTSVLVILPAEAGTRTEVVSAVVDGEETGVTVDLYTVRNLGTPGSYFVTEFEDLTCTLVELAVPDWKTVLTLGLKFALGVSVPFEIPLLYSLTEVYRSCPFIGDEAVVSVSSFTASPLPPRYVLEQSLIRDGTVIEEEFDWVPFDDSSFLRTAVFGSRLQRAWLGIRLYSPAVIRVTTPDGRVAGYDAETIEPLFGFPALFSSVGDEPFGFFAPVQIDGTYEVEVIGTGDGPYTLAFQTSDENGVGGEETVFHRTTNLGAVHEYEVTVSDGASTVSALNEAPQLDADEQQVLVSEGSTASNAGQVYDPDGYAVLLTATIGSVQDNGDGTWTWSAPTVDGPAESQVVTVHADDGNGGTAQASFDLVVQNVAPAIGSVSVPDVPVEVGTLVSGIRADFTDPAGAADTPHVCEVDFGDGTGVQVATASDTDCIAPDHVYTQAGIHQVTLRVVDKDGGADSRTADSYVVVYDPSGGLVTGGGWIDSPAGAYRTDPSLAGKANFGFVSRYKKGATVPTGNTEFQFKAGSLSFRSSVYEFLVVTMGGTNAQFKGSGLLDGQLAPSGEEYQFMIWARDGAPDAFRIRIWWDDAGVEREVYDNGFDQPLGGGSIVVHSK